MRLFLDTNVIIDFIDSSREKHKITVKLFNDIIINKHQIVISEDMLTTIFFLAKKDKTKTLHFLRAIQDKWKIAIFGNDIISNAIDLSLQKNLDLEDVLQCLCAKGNDCDTMITNDQYFYDCGLKIQTVNQFLR